MYTTGMLTDKDIQKLASVFPTKEETLTKQDLQELRNDFADLQTAVDAYAKKADTYFQEMLMLSHKVNTLEKWIHQIADKVGVQLDYLA